MAKGETLEPTPYQTLVPHADVQQWRNAFAAVQQRLRTLEGRTAHTGRIDDIQADSSIALLKANECHRLLEEMNRTLNALVSRMDRLEKDMYVRELEAPVDVPQMATNPVTGASEDEIPVEVLPEE